MKVHIFEDPLLFRIGGLPITETMITTLGVSAALLACAVLLRYSALRRSDSQVALFARLIVKSEATSNTISAPILSCFPCT